MKPDPKAWTHDFKAFLDLPKEEGGLFNVGTFSPDKTPTLTVKFIQRQIRKYPHLDLPTFEEYKDFFSYPPKPPIAPSKTEILRLADNKYPADETTRALFISYRIKLEWDYYEKQLAQFKRDQNQHRLFLRMNQKSEKGYLDYLKTHHPEIKLFLTTSIQRKIDFEDRLNHSYITGSTKSGKSELIKFLIYPFIQEKNPSSAVIVVDPAGDMALEIARFKEFYQNDRLVYFDPYLGDNKVPIINPFFLKESQITRKYIDKTAQSLINVFEEMIREEGGAGLTNQMTAILFPCLYLLLSQGDKSIADVQIFMKDKKNRELVTLGKKSPIKSHRDLFKNSFDLKAYQTSKHGVYSKILDLINSPIFYDCIVGESTIDLEECIQQKKVIIFNLSQATVGETSSRALGRFFISRILAFAMSQAPLPIQKRTKIHLIIDECQNYVSVFYKKILEEARKYQLYLTLAQQSCGQDMNTKLINAILSNTALKLTGINASSTLKTIANETGANLEELEALDKGVFHFKATANRFKKPSLPVQIPPALLGFKNSMTTEQWKETRQTQLDRYYRFIEQSAQEPAPGQPRKPKPDEFNLPKKNGKLDFGY